jgi:hypothetical protein
MNKGAITRTNTGTSMALTKGHKSIVTVPLFSTEKITERTTRIIENILIKNPHN